MMIDPAESTKPVMDHATTKHFKAWLFTAVHKPERFEVEQAMRRLLADYPELVETRSWPEIRMLAERKL